MKNCNYTITDGTAFVTRINNVMRISGKADFVGSSMKINEKSV